MRVSVFSSKSTHPHTLGENTSFYLPRQVLVVRCSHYDRRSLVAEFDYTFFRYDLDVKASLLFSSAPFKDNVSY